MNDYRFRLDFAVRDYECDLAGMVNNASYLNYIEHARHEFLKSSGIDFAGLAAQGVYLIVVRIELDFLYPLRSGDQFYVAINPERVSRLRFGFQQDIFRLPDEKPVLKAKVTGSAINENGRPRLPREILEVIDQGFGAGKT
jgi:acyl-CoA thioester hydrolase